VSSSDIDKPIYGAKKQDSSEFQRSKSCSDIDKSISADLIKPYVLKNNLKIKIVGLKKYSSEN